MEGRKREFLLSWPRAEALLCAQLLLWELCEVQLLLLLLWFVQHPPPPPTLCSSPSSQNLFLKCNDVTLPCWLSLDWPHAPVELKTGVDGVKTVAQPVPAHGNYCDTLSCQLPPPHLSGMTVGPRPGERISCSTAMTLTYNRGSPTTNSDLWHLKWELFLWLSVSRHLKDVWYKTECCRIIPGITKGQWSTVHSW